jgi:hypothetical protein
LIDFLCFRTVASLDNGDIVVGTNDGTIRIFSRDPSRYNQLNYTVRGALSTVHHITQYRTWYIIITVGTVHVQLHQDTGQLVQDATSSSVPETDI